MPITIQEIIASDTISQLVDKTNFNFDQLLLNGGGPGGPVGPAGPVGPGGGRGPKGSTWYEDTATSLPATDPNTIIVSPNLLTGDYYLDFDGWVWEYITAAWVKSTINLTGPQGSIGASGSFGLSFGSPLLGYKNTLYCAPIGTISPTTGATAANEGVPSIMMGGVATDTATTTGVPLTAAYQIPDAIAQSVTSNVASVLIHQRNNGGRSIVFHGGNAPADAGIDKFEQVTFSNLSNISIGVNDRLQLNVPKAAVGTLTSMNDLVGVEITSESRSHSHRAGQQIRFVTGIDTDPYGIAGENSNFEIQIQEGSNTTGNKFQIETQGSRNTLTEIGNIPSMITVQPSTPTAQFKGRAQYQASDIRFITAPTADSGFGVFAASAGAGGGGGNIMLYTNANTGNDAGTIFLSSGAGGITGSTTSGDIQLSSTTGDINLINNDNINLSAGGSVSTFPRIKLFGGTSQVQMQSNALTLLDLSNGITLNALNASAAISLNAAGVGSLVSITTNPTSGGISIGTSGTNTSPQIKLDYSGANQVMNIKGSIQYTKTGTWNNANAALQSIFVDNQGYSAGDAIVRIGNQTTSATAGVGALAIQDGSESGIWMGKSTGGGGVPASLGLYVNDTAPFRQSVTQYPIQEKFSATKIATKISNRMLWGGKNGEYVIKYDPMYDWIINSNPTPTSPYMKIIATTDRNTPGAYTAADYNPVIGNPGIGKFKGNSGWVRTINLPFENLNLITGQRVHIEVINMSSFFGFQYQQSSVTVGQYGQVKLRYADYSTNGTITYKEIDCGDATEFGGTQGWDRNYTSWTQTFQYGGTPTTVVTGYPGSGSYPPPYPSTFTKLWTPIGTPVTINQGF